MTNQEAKAEAEKIIKEIFNVIGTPHRIDPDINGLNISIKVAIIHVKGQLKLAERIFHDYGLGYMGAAISRNDFTKSALYKNFQSILTELKRMK